MKKIVALLSVICFLFTGGISYSQVLRMKEETSAASQITAVLPAEEAAVQIEPVDLASLYAAHPAEKVVGTVGGRELQWSEYFYFYNCLARHPVYYRFFRIPDRLSRHRVPALRL